MLYRLQYHMRYRLRYSPRNIALQYRTAISHVIFHKDVTVAQFKVWEYQWVETVGNLNWLYAGSPKETTLSDPAHLSYVISHAISYMQAQVIPLPRHHGLERWVANAQITRNGVIVVRNVSSESCFSPFLPLLWLTQL